MKNSQERRQEIYDKIKESSKQEYILSEMKRLGFWDDQQVDFKEAEAFFKLESGLSKELQVLIKEKNLIDDPAAFLAKKHQKRKLKSKQKQRETKEKRELLRLEKAEKWQLSKKEDIRYLGDGFSHQLNDQTSQVDRLKSLDLPLLNNAKELAQAMDIPIGELRFLSFSRKNARLSHYKRFKMKKKSGGFRLISAPMPRLKNAQYWILEEILNKIAVHPLAHGCVIGKSIKTNAEPHLQKAVVINQDFKNFFPSITHNRIKGIFKSFGYSEQLATIFSLLCSEPKIVEVSMLGEDYFAQRGTRFLPQGAPTSPAITNIICKQLDLRLHGLAKHYGFDYTRYVDDITFSGNQEQLPKIAAILKYSKKIVEDENFTLHPEKLRIMKRSDRQEVTGVVVNEKTNIPKKNLKRFRALLFQIEKDGIQGKVWNKKGNILAQIDGYANFIYQIDTEKGIAYKKRVGLILKAHGYKEAHQSKFGRRSKDSSTSWFTSLVSKVKDIFGSGGK
ncbi:MAG: RNA-dependent DNA polymerase [Flavobacteriaceae bacterium]|nr:MAG: RNA-dependent DNA polymerase [Flavobacteriaceae bacterium]